MKCKIARIGLVIIFVIVKLINYWEEVTQSFTRTTLGSNDHVLSSKNALLDDLFLDGGCEPEVIAIQSFH